MSKRILDPIVAVLKSGEYDGVTIMQAWLRIEEDAKRITELELKLDLAERIGNGFSSALFAEEAENARLKEHFDTENRLRILCYEKNKELEAENARLREMHQAYVTNETLTIRTENARMRDEIFEWQDANESCFSDSDIKLAEFANTLREQD